MVALFDYDAIPVEDAGVNYMHISSVLERRVQKRIAVVEGEYADLVLADFHEQVACLRGRRRIRKCHDWLEMYSMFALFEEQYGTLEG